MPREGVDGTDEITGATTLNTAANQWVSARYLVTDNGDGDLQISLRDLGGNDPNWVINALEVRPADTAANANSVGFIALLARRQMPFPFAKFGTSSDSQGPTEATAYPPQADLGEERAGPRKRLTGAPR